MNYRNPLAEYRKFSDQVDAFHAARARGEYAYIDTPGNLDVTKVKKPCEIDPVTKMLRVPLSRTNIWFVEFIGGLWRMQKPANYNIRKIRDQEFIMGPRINITEKNYFEYYQIARIPTFNCYGPINEPKFDMVAACYNTNQGEYWGYGRDVASARAFLGIRMYDECKDLIHGTLCKNQNNKKR